MHNGRVEVKANGPANFRATVPEFPPIHDETIQRAIQHVAYESDVNVKMIAREVCKAESTTYHKIDGGENSFTLAEFARIVRLSVAHNVHELIDVMLPDGFVLSRIDDVTDSLPDDVMRLNRDTGKTIDDFEHGRLSRAASDAQEVANDGLRIANRMKRGKR